MASETTTATKTQPKKSLRVGVLGPKGQCGSCVVDELLSRGHSVVGLSRSPPATWPAKGADYSAVKVDFNNSDKLAEVMSDNFDAIVCAYGPPLTDLRMIYLRCVETHCKIKTALLASTHKGPFLVIGGGGSLHNKDGSFSADEPDFLFAIWYAWPDRHLDYMISRAADHGHGSISYFISLFKWARNNIEHPGWFSWLLRPFARLLMVRAKKLLISPEMKGLILGSRVALHLWEGVTEKSWSFLSPPWLLRDKGIRTGSYQAYVDEPGSDAHIAKEKGVYNEDMAVAIVDEIENRKYEHKHWTCTGSIDLVQW